MVRIVDVGFDPTYVPYLDAWALQRRVHAEVIAGTAADTLLLLEHEPVYTAGRRTEPQERPADGTPVVDVDRGGKITWHGPGQLVGYPILRLGEPMDVVAYVRSLERLLIDVLGRHGVSGTQIEGRSGVWVGDGVRDAKVAAIGVRVEKGVTMHGFAINCDNDLSPFARIIPCGITDAGVTSVSEIVGHRVSPTDLRDTVANAFAVSGTAVAA